MGKKTKTQNNSSDKTLSRRGMLASLGLGAAGVIVLENSFFPTDPLPAYAVETNEELSLTKLAERINQIAVHASPDRFPGIDPTGATSSSDALKAAIKTVPKGGSFIIPPGDYIIDDNIANAQFNISIYGYGAKLIQNTAGKSVFVLDSKIPNFTSVSSIGTYKSSGSASSTFETDLPVLNTAVATGWKKGDLVKVYSDDEIPEARPGTDGKASRFGEFAVVAYTQGNKVFLVGSLREKYTTKNVRVALVPKDTIRIYGLEIETKQAGIDKTGGYGALFVLKGLYKPIIKDVRCAQAGNQVIQFVGVYAYLVDNLDIGFAENKALTSPQQLGYGVLDNSSSFGVIQNSNMRFVRHAYTDDTPRVAANDNTNIAYYGRTFGTKIINCNSLGTSAHSWDTHHSSEGVMFISCSASNGGPGAAGFGLRGKNHTVIDGRINNMYTGVSVYTENHTVIQYLTFMLKMLPERLYQLMLIKIITQLNQAKEIRTVTYILTVC
jgi:hypothetical protein